MIIGAIFLLFGGAALAAAFTSDISSSDSSDEEDSDDDEQQNCVESGIEIPVDILANFSAEISHPPNVYEVQLHSNLDEMEAFDSSDQLVDLAPVGLHVNDNDGVTDVVFVLTQQLLNNLPSPLADWTQHDTVDELVLGEGDGISIQIPKGVDGSIYFMDANYHEIQGGSEEGQIIEYTGTNVYFIPEGEVFPDNYSWSKEGASLYNTTNHLDKELDFSGVKLLLRIDSGFWTIATNTEGISTTVLDERIGTPQVQSNLRVLRDT